MINPAASLMCFSGRSRACQHSPDLRVPTGGTERSRKPHENLLAGVYGQGLGFFILKKRPKGRPLEMMAKAAGPIGGNDTINPVNSLDKRLMTRVILKTYVMRQPDWSWPRSGKTRDFLPRNILSIPRVPAKNEDSAATAYRKALPNSWGVWISLFS